MELDPTAYRENMAILSMFGKRAREEAHLIINGSNSRIDISEDGSEMEPLEPIQPPSKRRREELCQKIGQFKDTSSDLSQAKKYQNLMKHNKALLLEAYHNHSHHAQLAQKEIEKEWTELGVDAQAWEKKIIDDETPSHVKISKQFKFIINDDSLRKDHLRQLQIIFGIFMKHRHRIESKALKRITDHTSFFEQNITFSVNGKLFQIPKEYLLRSGSSCFKYLFEHADSCHLEPLELDLDEETFLLLDRWLRHPHKGIFSNSEFSEILTFLNATCQFDIQRLVKDCDSALADYVDEESVFPLLEEVYLFLKESRKRGIDFEFPKLQSALLDFLKSNSFYILHPDGLLKSPPVVDDIYFGKYRKFDKILSVIENMSIFKEMCIDSLNISSLVTLNDEQQEKLVTCFPNIRMIIIDFNYEYSHDLSSIKVPNWKFLNKFTKLIELQIYSSFFNDNNFCDCFKNTFPKNEAWDMHFDSDRYFTEGSNLSLDVDHFIEIKTLESMPSTFDEWPMAIRSCVEDHHLEKLMEAQKFNVHSPILDLTGMDKITVETLGLLLTYMTRLEELILNLKRPNLPSFVKCLLAFVPGLKKLTLPSSSFFSRDTVDGLRECILRQCRDIKILISPDSNPNTHPSWITYFRQFASLELAFQSWGEANLVIKQNSFKIELKESNENSQIGENEESRKHLTFFSQVLQPFSNESIVLDMKDVRFSSSTLIGLSQAFPYIKELQLGAHDFNPIALKGFYKLKTLAFKSPHFLDHFSQLQELQNYPVDILFDQLGIESSSLEEFIRKVRVYMDLLPNFQPLSYLTSEYRASMTDRDLLLLIPRKCHSNLDLNGMKNITSKAVLEILEAHPKIPLSLTNCQNLHQEIIEGKVSLDDFVKLAGQRYIQNLFSNHKEFAHLRKQLSDRHISQLIQEKKIIPHHTVDVSRMSLLNSAGFWSF